MNLPEGVELKLTCTACPEQYDMFLNGEKVGYFRLRFGYYTVTLLPWTNRARRHSAYRTEIVLPGVLMS